MRILFILLAFSLFSGALITDALSEVYKRTNPDGSVEFSDVPDSIKAEPIELKPSSSYTPPPPPKPTDTIAGPNNGNVNYESVIITSPTDDQAIRDNAGNLTVSVSSKPALQPGHVYILMMDGSSVGESPTGKFQLTNISRGTHTFTGQVADKNKQMIIQSSPISVHLIRAFIKRP